MATDQHRSSSNDAGDTGPAGEPEPADGPGSGDAVSAGEPAPADGPDSSDTDTHEAPAAPLLVARHLGSRAGRRWVFRGLTAEIMPGSVTALVAPAGSGKSSALLALSGRFPVTEGELELDGVSVTADLRRLRARTSIARISDMIVPEERLTVAESIDERSLIDGIRVRDGRTAFNALCTAADIDYDEGELVEHLPRWKQSVLAVILALLRPADIVLLDDTDDGVTHDQEREIYRYIETFARSGPAFVTSSSRRDAVIDDVAIVAMAVETTAATAGSA